MKNTKMETMLENILRVEGIKGGTIHQYFDITDSSFPYLEREYNELRDVSIEFNTRKAFQVLAKRHQLKYKGGE